VSREGSTWLRPRMLRHINGAVKKAESESRR
jgi:hypothetical protein